MNSFEGRGPLAIFLAAALAIGGAAHADGTLTGHARFEKIKGRPAMGFAELYESNLFLSPAGGAGVGPSRRLGAPPGLPPTYDGSFGIGAPAGSWSILVDQPLFFIRAKVIPDLLIQEGLTATRNVDLSIDYSTYFTDTWALPYGAVWYQTFTATGSSITGVSWKLAGTNATEIRASIHEDDGDPSPAGWPQVSPAAAKADSKVEARGDNWVRWRSGEVPTVPGKRYAIKLTGVSGGDLKFSPFNRAKDGNSYSGGQAFDGSGAPQDYDLNITVFSDNDGTAVLYDKTTEGLGDLRDGYYAGRWGQTFRATAGTSLAAVDVWAAGANSVWDLDFTWIVRKYGSQGPVVGPAKTTKAAFQSFGAGLHGVSYNPGEVPLELGGTYYIEFSNPTGFNPYVFDSPADAYPEGAGYQDGALKEGGSVDVSMTIVVYLGGGGTIRGKVTDSSTKKGVALASVTVDVLGRTVLTRGTGDYEVREVPEATYQLRASMSGYKTAVRPGVVVSRGEVAAVDFELERLPCAYQFANGGFEGGLQGWTRYGATKTSNPLGGWFGGIGPVEGIRFWGNEVNGQALGSGGAWQRFCSEQGHRYRASVWSNIYWIQGDGSQTQSRIGLHPAGGTARDAQVVYSAWDQQPLSATEGWRKIQVEARAAGTVMTVFLDFLQRDSSNPPPANQWRISCFDGVEFEDLDQVVKAPFERGDCNDDRSLDIADAIFLIFHLFLAGGPPKCPSACDTNDDGRMDLSDPVALLEHLFLAGDPPPAPRGACGEEETPDELACPQFDC